MPAVSQNLLNSVDVNSPPLSVLKVLIDALVSLSTFVLNFLNFSNASPLFFKSIDHMYRE